MFGCVGLWFGMAGNGRHVWVCLSGVVFGCVRLGMAGELWLGEAGQSELWPVLVRQGMVRQARYGKLCLVGFSCVTASYGRQGKVRLASECLGWFGRDQVWQARRVKVSYVALCFVEVSWGMVS